MYAPTPLNQLADLYLALSASGSLAIGGSKNLWVYGACIICFIVHIVLSGEVASAARINQPRVDKSATGMAI